MDTSSANLIDQVGANAAQVNFDYAVIERLNPVTLTNDLVSFNLGGALDHPDSSDNVALRAGDIVTVFSQGDVAMPRDSRSVFVRVDGEVRRPGLYQISRGETLPVLIERAGGLTRDAWLFGAEFTRESIRTQQQKQFDQIVREIEQRNSSARSQALVQRASQLNSNADAGSARLQQLQEQEGAVMRQVRNLKPNGRLSLQVSPTDNSLAQLPALSLESGDHFHVGTQPAVVQVFGAVSVESALLYHPGWAVTDYLKQSGVRKSAEVDELLVLRADGTLKSRDAGWFSNVRGIDILPGDIIYVPDRVPTLTGFDTFIAGAKDFTQIFFQLGLGAAAIKTLR